MGKIRIPLLGFCLVIGFLTHAALAADVVENLPNGVINWTQGMVTAKGNGAPPTGIILPSQARLMAERAARADALRNLLEAVKGVRVDAETTVENFTTKSDVVMTRVSGIVKGATVIEKRYLSDGGVEITMIINLTGELLAAMLQELPPITLPVMPSPAKTLVPRPASPKPSVQKPVPPAKIPAPVIPPVQKPSPPPPPAPSQETKVSPPPVPAEEKKATPAPEVQGKVEEKLDLKKMQYTGLIVDARKLGLRPALVPKIVNQKGELVYSSQSLEQKELVRMGLVGYAKDVDAAARNQRVTDDPYVISGMHTFGEKKTDVVISNQDAQIILTTAPYTGYLKHGRVMIVYD